MKNLELANEFDVLYNSITSNQAPGLDNYEKSVFLTKAQYEIIRDYFNGKTDTTDSGFDGSVKRQYDFSSLIKTAEVAYDGSKTSVRIDKRGIVVEYPSDFFLSVNEVLDDSENQYTVVPIAYTDYQRLMTKPFAYPPKRIVWRVFLGTNENILALLIGKYKSTDLTLRLRYVQKPTPIILSDLEDSLKIDGKSEETESILPDMLKQDLLERAVSLAKIAYIGGSTQSIAAANNKQ